jgi:hypothetical protein
VSGVDADHPYFNVGGSPDGTLSVYIGAYGDYVPAKIKDEVLIRAMIVQTIEEPGSPKGQEHEYVVMASCPNQTAKVVQIWQRPAAGAEGISRFPNLSPDKKADAIVALINDTESVPFPPNSPVSLVVDAGCNFVGQHHTPVKAKPREWQA